MQSKTLAQCRTKYSLRRNQIRVPPTPSPSLNSAPIDHIQPQIEKVDKVMTSYSRKNSVSSHCSHQSHSDNLLCQDCINKALMEDKYQSMLKERNEQFAPAPFEDKLRSHYSQYYGNKVKSREQQAEQAGDSLSRFKYNGKNDFINSQENGDNTFDRVNSNYLYERAKKNQMEKQKYIEENIDKFTNKERPEITSYFTHYINNADGKSQLITQYENEEKKKDMDYQQYRKDLQKQIEYKQNLERAQIENDAKIAREQYESMIKEIEKETNEKYLKQQKQKQELMNANLILMNEKMKKLQAEEEEKQRYNEQYKQEYLNEKEKEDKEALNNRLKMANYLKDNEYYIEKERERRMKEKEEEQKYHYNTDFIPKKNEEMGECMKCHRVFPRRLLTINRNFYTNNRK